MNDANFARGMWWWMPGPYEPAVKWCEANCKGKWTDEIDAAAMGFAVKSDYEAFKLAFPRQTLEYMRHYDFEGPRQALGDLS